MWARSSAATNRWRSLGIALALLAAGCGPSSAGDRPSTVGAALAKYGPAVGAEFRPVCRRLGIVYPPKRITLLAFKQERVLEVWGANARGAFGRLATYPILAASGALGPKKREGDLQVPEGFYRLTHLNPLSQFHLSIRMDYPNREDIAHSRIPRRQMGGDIYVHGNRVSVGCIAIGDSAIERVFCLTALARASSPPDSHFSGRLPQGRAPGLPHRRPLAPQPLPPPGFRPRLVPAGLNLSGRNR